jgi:nucleotide-binding universal stress UspA family protein
MSDGRNGPLVVAVGDAGHGRALDWAAAEAAAQRCRLHVIHAERFRWAADPAGLVPVADLTSFQGSGRHLVRAAVARARAVASDIEVTSEVVLGPTVPVVVAQARGARLLVVGSRSGSFRTGLRALFAPSVCRGVARRAPCPVVLVGTKAAAVRRPMPAPRPVVRLDPAELDPERRPTTSWE